MTDTDVERVAIALWEDDCSRHTDWQSRNELVKDDYRGKARAAIAAFPQREMSVQDAARVLLTPDEKGLRGEVYSACVNNCKVYKFDAALRALAGEQS